MVKKIREKKTPFNLTDDALIIWIVGNDKWSSYG